VEVPHIIVDLHVSLQVTTGGSTIVTLGTGMGLYTWTHREYMVTVGSTESVQITELQKPSELL